MPEDTVTQIQDGGQAFPGVETPAGGIPGMTLRDYFAAHALAHQDVRFVIKVYSKGEKKPNEVEYPPMEWSPEKRLAVATWMATDAYAAADAMLAERVKVQGR